MATTLVNVLTQSDSSENKLDSLSIAYKEMQQRWSLIEDLLGGTLAMRSANTKWLPQEPKEKDDHYDVRLSRSILYNGFKDTVRRITSKPFSKPVVVQGVVPEKLEEIEDNVDRTGRSLTQFGRDLFREGVQWGLTHVLVDFSQMNGNENKEEERLAGARPTPVHVTPQQLIGWQTRSSPQGKVLTQIRVKEDKVEPVGDYGEETVTYIRVYTETDWQLYRKGLNEEEYALVGQGTHSFAGVPLLTYYTNRTGFLTAEPPLEDLAWLNLAHWQSSSDQRNILRFVRSGILFAKGFTDTEVKGKIAVGPTQVVKAKNPQADLKYVTHDCKPIEAGERDIRKLEERMEIMGLQPLITSRTGNQTATARAMDESRVDTDVQSWIRDLEDVLYKIYEVSGEWVGVTLPEDFEVNIFNEFALSLRSIEDINALIKMRQSHEITRLTFYKELKRRGLLSESLDVELEAKTLEEEGPPPGLIGSLMQDDDDQDDDDDENNNVGNDDDDGEN